MIDDAKLMAYADGELTPADRAEVEAAAAADPDVARRLAEHSTLRGAARDAFAGVLDEPVPEHLRALIAEPKVLRPRFGGPPMRRVAPWLAIAASLMLGVLCGRSLDGVGQPLVVRDGAVVAGGRLAQALDRQLAADVRGPVRIGLTFQNAKGEYCRTFSLSEENLAGLACRSSRGWRAPVVASAAPATAGDYRMAASGLPPAVAAAVDSLMVGEAFDQIREKEARDRAWLVNGKSAP